MGHGLAFQPSYGLPQVTDGTNVFFAQQLQTVTGRINVDVFGSVAVAGSCHTFTPAWPFLSE
jgi:hypothetical protein